MQGVVFGVTTANPGVLLPVAIIVGLIAYLACYIPARRAMRTDPTPVLRQD